MSRPRHKTLPDELAALLTSRRYRRCAMAPGDKEKVTGIIETAQAAQRPLPLLIRWAKADYTRINAAEEIAIERLAEYLGRVAERYEPGIQLTVLFTDTHVMLNGLDCPPAHLQALQKCFDVRFGPHPGLGVTIHAASKFLPFTRTADGMGFEEFTQAEERAQQTDLSVEMLTALTSRAGKYGRSAHDPETLAKTYFELCKMEVGPLGRQFAGHIFLTYNHARQQEFSIPAGLPFIPLYSLPGKLTDKPWNIEPERAAMIAARYRSANRAAPETTASPQLECA